MVPVLELWLPIVVAAVFVFVASAIVHMVLPIHRKDYRQLPNEDKALEALRAAGAAPGAYVFPYAATPREMGTAEMLERYKRGPVGFVTLMPNGPPAMGKNLAQWFVFCVLVGLFAGYIAGLTLAPGADYLTVFRVIGASAFLGYGFGELVAIIWKAQPLGASLRNTIDGLVYALLTAGVFGWLWPGV